MMLAAIGAAGCASPPLPVALGDARLAYSEATVNAATVKHAPVEIYEAEQALRRAEAAWVDGDAEETTHLAYLAAKRIEIAHVAADQAMAEVDAGKLGERRTHVLLEARESALAAREAELLQARESALEAREAELANLKARKTKRGLVITLGDVLFQFGKAELKPGATRELTRLVAFLEEHSDRSLAIEGHTDSVGPSAFNRLLSQRRAQSVKRLLVRHGIGPSRITARGYGEGYPVASNASAAGRQQNRRVDLVILSPGSPAKARP